MRKNRNSFFTESNMNYSNFQAQGAIPQAMPYANANYNPYQAQPNIGMPYVDNSDSIENRLAKIERQINRLNARINKLENLNTTFLDDNIDTSGNMYML
ncbi:MAG: hypothetical protein U0M92_00065 [Bacilli bacterium]